jgi:antitoxin HicB
MGPGIKKIPAFFTARAGESSQSGTGLEDMAEADCRILGFDIAVVEFGWPGMPLCKSLAGGLWEVRSKHGRIARNFLCRARPYGPVAWGHCPKTVKGDRAMKNKHLGSSFDDFLKEQGIHDDAHAHAIKRALAWQIQEAMTAQGLSKSEMAKRMNTSRAQLDRLLDPENDKVQLDTVQRAAAAVGRKLHLELA